MFTVGAGCGPGGDVPAASEPAPVATETLESPAGFGSMAPELTLVRTESGPQAALTWLQPRPDGSGVLELRFARLAGDGWSEPSTIVGEGAELFANWADRPGVVQGAAPPSGDGALFAYWLAKNGGSTYAYEVEAARSDDGGLSWRPLGRLHADDSAAEHGFVSAVPEGDGIRAFWLDGRATVDGNPMTLRTVRVGEEVDRSTEELLDDSVCDCCSTAAVAGAAGPLVVYRDRTAEEIRDPWMVRRGSGGGWSAPAPLHRDGWTIPACPVNGPAAGRRGDTVWVAWYTAEGGRARILAAVSPDGGATFGEPVTIDAPDDSGAPLGRLDLAIDDGGGSGPGDAVISWLDTAGGEAVVRLRRLGADGRTGPPVSVARASGSRASGVPRLLALPGPDATRLLVAWVDPGLTDDDVGRRTIRLVALPATTVPPSEPI